MHALFRPPAEAHSLILRVADGCPWNGCTFCGMYKGVRYRPVDRDKWLAQLDEELAYTSRPRRVFLADGDVMALPTDEISFILQTLNERIPRLSRVNVYANGHSILKKSSEELEALHALKLNTLYMGLESGSNEVLTKVNKQENAGEMIEAAQRAQAAGLKMSVMVLIGLGGQPLSSLHAQETAKVLNAMQPRLLSALRLTPTANTPLGNDKSFDELSEYDATIEMRELVQNLSLKRTVFRANHVSNIMGLEGRFPSDRARLLSELDQLLDSEMLDRKTAGPRPLSL